VESLVEKMLGKYSYLDKLLILVTESVKNREVTQKLWKPVVEDLMGSLESVANFKVIVRLPKLATGERNIFSSTVQNQPSQRRDIV
jgi:hypothetical protein